MLEDKRFHSLKWTDLNDELLVSGQSLLCSINKWFINKIKRYLHWWEKTDKENT